MAREKRNPAGWAAGGAQACPIAQSSDSLHHSATRPELQPSPSAAYIDELLFKLTDHLRRSGLSDFEVGFCKSILRQAKRGGPRWRPSERQRAVAEKILSEHDGFPDEPLVELDP